MIPFFPLILVVGGAVAYAHRERSTSSPLNGQMTAARSTVLHHALHTEQPPEKLRALAAAFEGENLPQYGAMLRQRAALREQPKELYQARKRVFRKAMSSTDSHAVRLVANAHEQVGAHGAAAALRHYADALDTPEAEDAPPVTETEAVPS